MGITNYIEFGGVNSSDYGIYVSGEGTFNAPERDVELIEIPGRNGDFSLDKGRFKNITVTYPVYNFEGSLEDFRTKLSDFRNALKSQIGYQRLEDTFHPDEYRMAVFVDAFDVKPVMYNTASTIELTFNCKPQRFLKSGETAQTVASGGTITNPTPFEASPLIEAEGYGTISIDGQSISIVSQPIGDVTAWIGNIVSSDYPIEIPVDTSQFSTGDTIRLSAVFTYMANGTFSKTTQASGTSDNADMIINNASFVFGNNTVQFDVLTAEDIEFTVGTSKTVEASFTINTTNPTNVFGAYLSISYDPTIRVIYISASFHTEHPRLAIDGSVEGYSTKIMDTNTFIDCEIGEAYYLENDEVISANNSVTIPAILPKLNPGNNGITYDNTITELKITPRWWRI